MEKLYLTMIVVLNLIIFHINAKTDKCTELMNDLADQYVVQNAVETNINGIYINPKPVKAKKKSGLSDNNDKNKKTNKLDYSELDDKKKELDYLNKMSVDSVMDIKDVLSKGKDTKFDSFGRYDDNQNLLIIEYYNMYDKNWLLWVTIISDTYYWLIMYRLNPTNFRMIAQSLTPNKAVGDEWNNNVMVGNKIYVTDRMCHNNSDEIIEFGVVYNIMLNIQCDEEIEVLRDISKQNDTVNSLKKLYAQQNEYIDFTQASLLNQSVSFNKEIGNLNQSLMELKHSAHVDLEALKLSVRIQNNTRDEQLNITLPYDNRIADLNREIELLQINKTAWERLLELQQFKKIKLQRYIARLRRLETIPTWLFYFSMICTLLMPITIIFCVFKCCRNKQLKTANANSSLNKNITTEIQTTGMNKMPSIDWKIDKITRKNDDQQVVGELFGEEAIVTETHNFNI